jgi:membrane protease subunit (stomatin/prohibitin family)
MAVDLDVKFGTPTPIQLTEPRYNVIVPIRAHGQMGLRLGDPRQFLRELVGTMGQYTTDQIYNSFRGMVITKLKSVLGETIIKEKVSILDIAAMLDPLSVRCREAIRPEFERFGLDVVNLFVNDVSFPEDDPIVKRLRATVMDRADFEILGDQRYGTKRSFDVMDKAAENPSGAGGTIMGAGLGLGLGAGIGAQAASVGGALNPNPQQVPTPSSQNTPPNTADVATRLAKLKELLDQNLITQQDFDARKADILREV